MFFRLLNYDYLWKIHEPINSFYIHFMEGFHIYNYLFNCI